MSKKSSHKFFVLAAVLLLGSVVLCQAQQPGPGSRPGQPAKPARTKKISKTATMGWTSLFNGRDLSGWHSYLKPRPGSAWKVSDGAIMLDHSAGGEGGDLVTNGEYQNFELEMDWKISVAGNSGIIFLVDEDPKYSDTYMTGPEMQVLDNVKASDNKKANHLAGSLYDLIACNPATVHPAGQWNHVKIRLDKGSLTFWMNGKQVVHTQMWDNAWNKMIAASKFHQWPEFATYRKGHLALQDHGHNVWFRNIRIRQL